MKPLLGMAFAFAAASLLAAGMSAVAQVRAPAAGYPTKTIRMVVPFSAGGGTDLIGRLLAKEMTELLGQTVLLDNRTGNAGGACVIFRDEKTGLLQAGADPRRDASAIAW